MTEPTPGRELARVEVLDATDPDVTRRVRPVVLSAFLNRGSATFWALSAVLAASIAGVLHLAFGTALWWVLLLLALPAGSMLYSAMMWAGLTFQLNVRPGDHWLVLSVDRGVAVVLVKPRGTVTILDDLAADPRGMGLGRELGSAALRHVQASRSRVTCHALGKNIARYEKWGMRRSNRVWWAPLVWEMTSQSGDCTAKNPGRFRGNVT